MNRLGRPLINGKGFSKISKPTERNSAYHLQFDFPADERLRETENWKEVQQMDFRLSSPPLEVQFLKGFFGKLLFHLTFNRNFLLNGKHPSKLADLVEAVIYRGLYNYQRTV